MTIRFITKEDMNYTDLKNIFRIVNPWRIKNRDESVEYKAGWNDCLKELKKRQKKFIESLYDIGDLC